MDPRLLIWTHTSLHRMCLTAETQHSHLFSLSAPSVCWIVWELFSLTEKPKTEPREDFRSHKVYRTPPITKSWGGMRSHFGWVLGNVLAVMHRERRLLFLCWFLSMTKILSERWQMRFLKKFVHLKYYQKGIWRFLKSLNKSLKWFPFYLTVEIIIMSR